MMRTLQGQGPKVQSILTKPQTLTFEDLDEGAWTRTATRTPTAGTMSGPRAGRARTISTSSSCARPIRKPTSHQHGQVIAGSGAARTVRRAARQRIAMSVDVRELRGQCPHGYPHRSKSPRSARPSGRRWRSAAQACSAYARRGPRHHRRQRLGQEHARQGHLGRAHPRQRPGLDPRQSPRPRRRGARAGHRQCLPGSARRRRMLGRSTTSISAPTTCSRNPPCHEEKVAQARRADARAARLRPRSRRRRSATCRSASSNGSPSRRALLTDPKVLILDESSAALDFDSTERLFAQDAPAQERRAPASSSSRTASPNSSASPTAPRCCATAWMSAASRRKRSPKRASSN